MINQGIKISPWSHQNFQWAWNPHRSLTRKAQIPSIHDLFLTVNAPTTPFLVSRRGCHRGKKKKDISNSVIIALAKWQRNQVRLNNPFIKKIPMQPKATATIARTEVDSEAAAMIFLLVLAWWDWDLSAKLPRRRLLRLSIWCMICRCPRAIPDI